MTALVDVTALDSAPLRPAETVPALEHPALPDVLAVAMPRIRHSRQSLRIDIDEHTLVDRATGSAVRVRIAWDRECARSRTRIAALGPRPLWAELVACLHEWERYSRTIPQHWTQVARDDRAGAQ